MTEAKVEQRVEEVSPEERRWAAALLIMGIVSVLGLFFGPAAFATRGEGGARAAVFGVGVNGSHWVEAAPGSIVVFEMPLCNLADKPAAVWARVSEVPEGVRVFAVYVNGSFFGVKWAIGLSGGGSPPGRLRPRPRGGPRRRQRAREQNVESRCGFQLYFLRLRAHW
ncbi:hypothetical protein [Pyrobaculum aerophilum]|uniref:hypothetical protein n=1 Tax=Pyrobaculum aerophilum TaxID=13773 RepID=UPI0021612437|nr:hypothetical protein [Pyrobaculum aerophilum]